MIAQPGVDRGVEQRVLLIGGSALLVQDLLGYSLRLSVADAVGDTPQQLVRADLESSNA